MLRKPPEHVPVMLLSVTHLKGMQKVQDGILFVWVTSTPEHDHSKQRGRSLHGCETDTNRAVDSV